MRYFTHSRTHAALTVAGFGFDAGRTLTEATCLELTRITAVSLRLGSRYSGIRIGPMYPPATFDPEPNPNLDAAHAGVQPAGEGAGLVLVVDDETQALEFIRRDLVRARLPNPIFYLNNGKEAIEYVSGAGRFKYRNAYPLPSLLVVDWRMPIFSGKEIIHVVRSELKLAALPIVVLTASSDIDDMREAYNAGATSYLVKPLSTDNVGKMFAGLMAR